MTSAQPSAVPCIVMGLGSIGRAIAQCALTVPGLKLVGCVDPAHAGRTLAEVLEGAVSSQIEVKADLTDVARLGRGGIVFQATSSFLHQVEPQLEACIRARLNVVSTCEELAYPWLAHKDAAMMLDRSAVDFAVRLIGTGVNPGFIFERVGAMMSQVVGRVNSVKGVRVVDASTRRRALQQKTGAGLKVSEFASRVENGRFGHVGLRESAALLAHGCGIRDALRISEEISPVIATRDHDAAVAVRQGEVAGIRHVARAFRGDELMVSLDLTIAVGAANPHDEITIEADTPFTVRVSGGTPGDSATAWAAIHAAQQILRLPPGLKTVLDLPAGRGA